MDCLNSCRKTLDVCIHLLTSMEIANCIIDAHKRGVKVRVVCDNEMSTNKGSQVRIINQCGVNVRIPLLNYHMHSKIAIIDGWKVMAGSVNWTVQGMYGNWDNLVITSQKDIVKDAMETFDLIWNNFDGNIIRYKVPYKKKYAKYKPYNSKNKYQQKNSRFSK